MNYCGGYPIGRNGSYCDMNYEPCVYNNGINILISLETDLNYDIMESDVTNSYSQYSPPNEFSYVYVCDLYI